MINILNYGVNEEKGWSIKGEEDNKKFLAAWCSYENKNGENKDMFVPISQYIENPKELSKNPEAGLTMTKMDKVIINKVKEEGKFALVYIDLQEKDQKIADINVGDNAHIFLYRLIGRHTFIALVQFDEGADSKIEITAQTANLKGIKYTIIFDAVAGVEIDSNVNLVPIYIPKFHPGFKSNSVARSSGIKKAPPRHKIYVGRVEKGLKENEFIKLSSVNSFIKKDKHNIVENETNIYIGSEVESKVVEDIKVIAKNKNAKVYISKSELMGYGAQYKRVL